MKLFKENENNEKLGIYALIACFYFISMPLSIVPLPGGISLLKVLSIFSGSALVLAFFLLEGKNEIQFNSMHLFLVLYVIYSIGSLFILYDPISWANLRGIIETTVLLFFISIKAYNQREKNALLNSWLIASVITIIAMAASSVELGSSDRFTIDIGGGVEDPNQLCGYFLLPLLICMEKSIGKTKYKIIYISLIIIMIYIAFTTGSRGGLAAIFATIIAYGFIAVKGVANKLKLLASLTIVFVVFSVVLFPLLPESVTERMSIESIVSDRGSGRLDLWTITFDAITQNNTSLMLGNGLGSTIQFLHQAGSRSSVAHNHWLQIWCDQGFIGMLLFFIVLFTGMLRSMSNNRNITVALFGMFVLSLSLTLYATYKPFWNLLMMSAMNYKGRGVE
ncbi:MAG: O-antigen ligase family protein [Clostridiaceae bacterium]|nr:O-antigen ligase family protein [Clostridiaceae bacterium]